MVLALIIVFGLVIGLIARALMTGNQQLGLPMTIGLGVPASFIGGRSAALVTSHEVTEFHIVGIVGSVLGVLVTLIVVSGFRRPRADACDDGRDVAENSRAATEMDFGQLKHGLIIATAIIARGRPERMSSYPARWAPPRVPQLMGRGSLPARSIRGWGGASVRESISARWPRWSHLIALSFRALTTFRFLSHHRPGAHPVARQTGSEGGTPFRPSGSWPNRRIQ